VQALFAAHDALAHEDDVVVVTKATENLRRVAPDQPILPELDAKIARMLVIRELLDRALAKKKDEEL
jgi:hypothetical protein